MVLVGNRTIKELQTNCQEYRLEILVLNLGRLYVQQRNYLSIYLYEFGHEQFQIWVVVH
jgi:hypothetical protein